MRALVAAAALVAAVALLWGAGELHRRNCIQDGRTSCSVLPWDSGQHAAIAPPQPGSVECVREQVNAARTGEKPPDC